MADGKDGTKWAGFYKWATTVHPSKPLMLAEWGVTDNNRRARYYTLSAAGRAQLRAETKNWTQYAKTISGILTAPKDAGGAAP